jgi:carboxylate-amine ligase
MSIAEPGSGPIIFEGSPNPTLGVEVELQLIDPETRQLVNRAPELLEAFGDPIHCKPELLQCMIELNTDVCTDVAHVRRDLGARLKALQVTLDELGLAVSGTATHPCANWKALKITDDQRYLDLVENMQWVARQCVIFGLHVHVGVPDGEKAIAVATSLSAYLPFLLGLSASSPYWLGDDTGLASVRVKIFEALPTAGLPHLMTNWNEFVRYMRTLINAGAISSIREVWWDVRPHLAFGTIEVRICDGVNTLSEIVSLVAMIQALVVWLGERYDAGDVLPTLKDWTLRENKWRACRYGTDARLIVTEKGGQKSLAQKVEEMIEELGPTAMRLGSLSELERVRALLANPNFKRQKAVFGETGSFGSVVDECIRELKEDRPTVV